MQTLAKQIRLALPHALLFARRLDAIQEQAVQALGPEGSLWWPGPGCVEQCLAQRASTWYKAFTRLGKPLPLSFWLPGITRCEPGARWRTGTALSSLIWPCIAPSLRVFSRCLPFGILTGLLLVGFLRVFPPSNGRDQPHPILPGWQLWALLFSLLDCSNVSHGFEPCLRYFKCCTKSKINMQFAPEATREARCGGNVTTLFGHEPGSFLAPDAGFCRASRAGYVLSAA
jgi:hypothetical protein